MPVGGTSNDELDEVDLWFEAAIADVKLAQAREEEAGRLMTLAAVGRYNRIDQAVAGQRRRYRSKLERH